MSFTLNEIESMGMKAARGAGLDWGIAEEAGKAARWLAARGLPGPELLVELLTKDDGRRYEDMAPASVAGVWTAGKGCLNPLITGAILTDHAELLAQTGCLELGRVAFPLLLAPFGATCARILGLPIELRWSGAIIGVEPNGTLVMAGNDDEFFCAVVESARCQLSENGDVLPPAGASKRRAIDNGIWDRLNAFAYRTYAPATETSRILGAGADLIDDE